MQQTSALTFDLNGLRVPRSKQAQASGVIPGLVVCPFAIVVSTNEIAHAMDYTFGGMTGANGETIVVPTVPHHLVTGDYSIKGFENRCCVERKQLADIFMCCGTDRRRFQEEIERMAAMEFAIVVIEADWREIINPSEYRPGWQSEMNPKSVEGSIVAWSLRYGIHFWACGDRRGAECRTFSILRKFWDEQQKTA